MDSDTGVSGCEEANECRAVGAVDLTESVAEVVFPTGCVDDLDHGEEAFGSAHVAWAALLSGVKTGSDLCEHDGVASGRDEGERHVAFVDDN